MSKIHTHKQLWKYWYLILYNVWYMHFTSGFLCNATLHFKTIVSSYFTQLLRLRSTITQMPKTVIRKVKISIYHVQTTVCSYVIRISMHILQLHSICYLCIITKDHIFKDI